MKKFITLAALAVLACALHAQNPRIEHFTNNVTSKISSAKKYTHALNFSRLSPAEHDVLGVPFRRVAGASGSRVAQFDGRTYTWSGFPPQNWNSTWGWIKTPQTEVVSKLFEEFAFVDAYAESNFAISNLVAGAYYEISLYFGRWDNAPVLDFYFDPDGEAPAPIQVNIRDPNAPGDRRLIYRYVAPENGMLKIHAERPDANGNTRGLFIWAFTNELLEEIALLPPEDATMDSVLLGARWGSGTPPDEVRVFWAFEDWGDTDTNAWLNALGGGSATATLENGVWTAKATPLQSATDYAYRYVLDTAGVLTWSDLGAFTTRGSLPEIYMLRVVPNLAFASVDVRLDWCGADCGAAEILLVYGATDWEEELEDWLGDSSTLSVSHENSEVGNYTLIPPLPDAEAYFCRAFAISGAGTNAAPEGLVFTSILSQTSALAKDWVWLGTNSTDWADRGNWGHPATFEPPGHISEIDGKNLLIGAGTVPFLPLNQNIPGLAVNQLQIAGAAESFTVDGLPFSLLDRFNCLGSMGGSFTVAFSNDIRIVGETAWAFQNNTLTVDLFGELSEPEGVPKTLSAAANVNLYGPVKVTGGIGGTANYRHPEAVGGAATGTGKDNFYFSYQNFHLPPGKTEQEYELPPENGLWLGQGGNNVSMNVAPGVTVLVNRPVTGNYALVSPSGGDGIIEFTAPTNTWTGGLAFEGSCLLIIRGEIPEGNVTINRGNGNSGVDLDGQDFLGRHLQFWNRSGHNSDGLFRNQNPDKRSTINGDMVAGVGYVGGPRPFGGVGDILYTGNITDTETGGSLNKAGIGTLTMTGASVFPGATFVLCGALVLDHSINNARKISPELLWLCGNFTLLGNLAEDTVLTVGDIGLASEHNMPWFNRVRVTVAGQGGNNATLRFGALKIGGAAWETAPALDFAPNEKGSILTSTTNVFNTGVLSVGATHKGESFACVLNVPPVDGYRPVGPFQNYFPDFRGAGPTDFVDITEDAILPVVAFPNNTTIAALRFNAPATLTLEGNLVLRGDADRFGGYNMGGLLVTPNTGGEGEGVVINGPGVLQNSANGGFIIHQYNTNAALTVNARIGSGGMGLTKTGPGELVLTHTNSVFDHLYIHEGIVTFDSIGNIHENSPLGVVLTNQNTYSRDTLLGDATLRYTGKGHSTDRRIRLNGFAVVEANGTGPLVFTHATPFYPYGLCGNKLLTLSGEKEGVIEGRLDLRGGRMRKRGEGTWTLTETSHSPDIIWGADVMDGTLVLNGTLGRDVTVYTNGTLQGEGLVKRNLTVKKGGVVFANPDAGKWLEVGKNLLIKDGAKISLPKKLPTNWTPMLKVHGKITGEFEKPNHAYVDYDHINGLVSVRLRPIGTLLMVR